MRLRFLTGLRNSRAQRYRGSRSQMQTTFIFNPRSPQSLPGWRVCCRIIVRTQFDNLRRVSDGFKTICSANEAPAEIKRASRS